MNAVFRYRFWIIVLLYLLGFLLPWQRVSPDLGAGTLWLAASALLFRVGQLGAVRMSLETATVAVTMAALLCCIGGAALRLWGTAYLGSAENHRSPQVESLVAAGPYSRLRNPLYVGTFFSAVGAAILMSPLGALFFLATLALLEALLISVEESFLTARLGDAYRDYLRRVPSVVPRLRIPSQVEGSQNEIPAQPLQPRWLDALFAEAFPVFFALCFAVFAWRYNALILIRCLLVSFGLALVVRALRPLPRKTA